MNCPKCLGELQQLGEICPHCGIVFAKYRKYHPEPASEQPATTIIVEPESSLLLQQAAPENLLGRTIIFAVLAVWSWRLIGASIASNATGESLLHLVNLPFHEAGHVLFRPFGAFITSLGGTLGQLLMPAICAGVLLLKTRDPYGASVAAWWFGENFLDIAPYMDDARAGQLPLVGGNFGHLAPYGVHDWNYLLNESGLLQYDHALAKAVFALGALIMLASLLWSGMLLHGQYRRSKSVAE
ncbi:MAG: zinc ribbon domain-containing protein [Methylobacter sp.]